MMSLSLYAQNQKWNAVSHRDDFNDNTIYTFTLTGVDNAKLFIGYIKNDIPSKSIVRACKGIYKSLESLTLRSASRTPSLSTSA